MFPVIDNVSGGAMAKAGYALICRMRNFLLPVLSLDVQMKYPSQLLSVMSYSRESSLDEPRVSGVEKLKGEEESGRVSVVKRTALFLFHVRMKVESLNVTSRAFVQLTESFATRVGGSQVAVSVR